MLNNLDHLEPPALMKRVIKCLINVDHLEPAAWRSS